MAEKKMREDSYLRRPQSQDWSGWKKAMVPENNGKNTVSRWQNQEGFIWKKLLSDTNLTELCGIYEWRAIEQDQTNPVVVYVGSTCTRRGICKKLHSRILGYCYHGSHKKDQINQALRRGYTLEVRYKEAKDEVDAKKQENDLLDKYDYAWNKRRNGGNNGIRDILPE